MKNKAFSLMAVVLFTGSLMSVENSNKVSLIFKDSSFEQYDEPCIAMAFALEELYDTEFSYEAFSNFVDSCKEWPVWQE